MTTVLVTGANGQLGSEFKYLSKKYPDFKLLFTDIAELDILDMDSLTAYVKLERPDYIINCAAYTNVDGAEENGVIAYKLNSLGLRNISKVSKNYDVGCIHISTDYVFSGNEQVPYTESSRPQPINVYGLTKYFGEQELIKRNPSNSLIIRTSWLYSSFGDNFVKTILKLAKDKSSISVVNDQFGSPTYARDLAEAILKILPYKNKNAVEIFNFANYNTCSWFEYAKEIVELSSYDCKVIPVSSEDFQSKAKRPKYSILNTEKFEKTFQISMTSWKNSLKECLNTMKEC